MTHRFCVCSYDTVSCKSSEGLMPFKVCLFRRFPQILHSLVILQMLGVPPVMADWVLVDGNERAKVYVDSQTIQRDGALVTLWVLDDLRAVHTGGSGTYRSSRAQEQHDCIEQRFRVLALASFSGSMGSGREMHASSAQSRRAPIPHGTLAQAVWKFVCTSKK